MPNLNAHIEAFRAIRERECYSRHEFESFIHAYREITWYMDYYNKRRKARQSLEATWPRRSITAHS